MADIVGHIIGRPSLNIPFALLVNFAIMSPPRPLVHKSAGFSVPGTFYKPNYLFSILILHEKIITIYVSQLA